MSCRGYEQAHRGRSISFSRWSMLVWLVIAEHHARCSFPRPSRSSSAIVVSLFDKDNRITPAKRYPRGARSRRTRAPSPVAGGLLHGGHHRRNCITATGLASKLISAVVSISNQVAFVNPQVIIAMFLTMICCISARHGRADHGELLHHGGDLRAYPREDGRAARSAAHFFVFYFGIVADHDARRSRWRHTRGLR